MEICVFCSRRGDEEDNPKIHMQSHGNLDFPCGKHLQDPCVRPWKSVFFLILNSYAKLRKQRLAIGRHLKDPCVRLWSYFSRRGHGAEIFMRQARARSTRGAMEICVFFAVGGMEKTCLKSKCSAIETFTFHSASICKIHAWGYGNAFFWRKGDGE